MLLVQNVNIKIESNFKLYEETFKSIRFVLRYMKNDYNFIAPYYDLLVSIVFGQSVFHAQIECFECLPKKGHVLFIGGGSGKALKLIVDKRPELKITYLERSKKMISLCQKRIGNNPNVNYSTTELTNLATDHYDAILSLFFFDIFEQSEQERLFKLIDDKLKVGGVWLISDFLPPKKWQHKAIETLMFMFLKLTTSIASKQILHHHKLSKSPYYECIKEKLFYNQFIFAAIYCKKRSKNKVHK